MRIADTLGFLLGTWQLERLITDHRSGVSGTFSGRATLVERPAAVTPLGGDQSQINQARYDEAGEISFGAHRGPASRRLDYNRLQDGAVLLCFADASPFIEIDLRGGTCTRVHDCRDDAYEVTMTVISQDVVQERWQVRGPAKDYVALTTMIRVA